MVLPVGAKTFEEAVQMGSETYHLLKVIYLSDIVVLTFKRGKWNEWKQSEAKG